MVIVIPRVITMVIGNLWLPVVRLRYITNEQIISQNPSHANNQIVHYDKRNPLQQTEKKHFSCKVPDVPLCILQSLIQRTACLIILNTNTRKETRQLLSLSAKHCPDYCSFLFWNTMIIWSPLNIAELAPRSVYGDACYEKQQLMVSSHHLIL